MSQKPRIAFCFSWQARTLDQTYLFFQKNLFDTAKEQWFDYDIFCAVEDDDDVDKVNLLNPTKIEKIKSSYVEKIIIKNRWSKYEKDILASHAFVFFDHNKNDALYIKNALQQFFKVSKSTELMNNYWKNYDLVVRLRFDCFLFQKLNYYEIINITNKWLVLCNEYRTWWNKHLNFWEINDFFLFGSKKSLWLLSWIFTNFFTALKWSEIKWWRKFLYIIFRKYKDFAYIINKKVFRRWILPIKLFRYLEQYLYRIRTPELIYYYYFKNQWINIIKDRFSFILLRKDLEKSIVKLESKNKFEL